MLRAVLAFVLVLTVAAPAGAASSSVVDRAAQALRSDPVYNDPNAPMALSDLQVAAVRQKISGSGAGPMYVAILPESALNAAGGSLEALVGELRQAVGRRGTYVVVAGTHLGARSDVVPTAGDVATQAIQEHKTEGLPAVLDALIAGVAQARSGGGGGSGSSDGGGDGGGGGGGGVGGLALIGALVLGGGAFYLVDRSRRRRERQAELEHVKDQVRDELVELGEGIRALDLDVELDGRAAQARGDYERAVSAYDRANTAWNTARSVDDLEPVGAALEEGRWALAAAKAQLEGRPVPERRPPCFFDPRHGPSSRDVMWTPPGGTPRPVPACEADAQRVDRGIDPGFREIQAGGQLVPYWAAGPAYSPFFGSGMFGGFGGLGFGGGLLGGLMLGELLDGPDVAYGDPGDWGGGDGGDFGGGDFGGGDFGGGDFGGGDFGGGDFGGGDFGGGDF